MKHAICCVSGTSAACSDLPVCRWRDTCFCALYERVGGEEQLAAFMDQLAEEIAALGIPGMPRIDMWEVRSGKQLNEVYPAPDGGSGRFFADEEVYLCAEVPCVFGEGWFFSAAAGMDRILVAAWEADGMRPELLHYQRR